ncbi:hypothetical protein cyc_04225 [Cyclospora cayetanensis]|uniref:Uncharacterized protein n=1 Tax=Cyclospora cayetanensis TaxID=88456 RepID=A0A1D3CY83_9EIME|nr:hypothetical protein cyc_04225 [Cyclospora cayetanensis]
MRLNPGPEDAAEMTAAFSEWLEVITHQDRAGCSTAAAQAAAPAGEDAPAADHSSTLNGSKTEAASGDSLLRTASRDFQQQAVCSGSLPIRGGAQW